MMYPQAHLQWQRTDGYDVLQFWLLGYEFPATLMVFTTEALYIVTTAKKGTCLVPLRF